MTKAELWKKLLEQVDNCDGKLGMAISQFENDSNISDEDFKVLDNLMDEWLDLANAYWDLSKAEHLMTVKYCGEDKSGRYV